MKTLDEVINVEPYDYQKEGILSCIKHHYIIVGDEMGLGKSLQALSVAALFNARALIVCPAYLKLNWENEFNKFCTTKKKINIIKTKKDLSNFRDFNVNIISYSMLKIAFDLFRESDVIIADEAHYLKNTGSKRTRIFTEFISLNSPERLIFLTGTPIDKHINEFYSLLYMCSFNIYSTSGTDITDIFLTENDFKDHFSRRYERKFKVNGRTIRKTEWKGLRNIDDLKKILKGKFIRRKAANVLDLPDLIFKNVVLSKDIDGSKDLAKAFNDFTEGKKLDSATKSHSAYMKAEYTSKYVLELLEETDDFVVVFTAHINPIQILYHNINKHYSCKVITGNVSVEDRNNIVTKLQEGDIRVLISTIGSGSTGFNMTRANHIVFNDKSWKQSDNEQAIKRIHRIGQKNKCIIHNIICSSIDNKIELLLKEKQKSTNHIL